MASVVMKEAPGIEGEKADCYQCPYFGQMYLAHRVDEQGEITDEKVDPPATCRRCGSPLDLDKAQKFQDDEAGKADIAAPRTVVRRRIAKV